MQLAGQRDGTERRVGEERRRGVMKGDGVIRKSIRGVLKVVEGCRAKARDGRRSKTGKRSERKDK